ncbi:MAG TPA: hypothetical protein DCZ93_10805 [Elusimicrobia bacterium]|nr:MAG: hypothetical protein A2X35_04740 [Elusimicrobia bacterium GWA2_61_42]OGR76645.1 MAG: hypothetical protein A2X38_03655 [Elusimicrobia bacterium GWC2_61_25]HBB67763.1 hypothetical protein [Elusimicrobiota bacterium]
MKKYIALSNNMTFQRRPSGASLVKTVKDDGNWKNKYRKTVNMDGARILELCDGQLTTEEMLAKHNRLYPDNILSKEAAAAFFAAAEKEEMIVSGPEKIKSDAHIAGSYEHYYPNHITFELTDQCNYRCKHCYRESSPDLHKRLDLAKIKEYITALRENGGSIVELTGGEPMLHPDFFEIVDFACKNMNLVAILTNGYYLQEEAIQKLLKNKKSLIFNISLDSDHKECHDKFRGKEGAFDKTINAMRLLGENGFLYRTAMSVTDENNYDIEGTIQLARKYGARTFTYNHVMDVGRGEGVSAEGRKATAEATMKRLEYEGRLKEEHKDFINFLSVEQVNALKSMNCGTIHRTVVVGPDGEVRPCAMFAGGVIDIGNVNKLPFTELFKSGVGNFFAKVHAPKQEICGDCKHLRYCGNCILRGIKRGNELHGCKWLEKTGVMKYVRNSPENKVCGNTQEPMQP